MLLVSWQVKVVISLLVVINLYGVFFKHGVRVPYSKSRFGDRYARIVWGSDNDWQLVKHNGKRYDAYLLGSSYVHRQLLVLNFKLRGKSWYNRYQTLILLPDSVDADCFRRLCVRLRLVRDRLVENSLV